MEAPVRVLIVEDNLDSADCLALLLRHFGADVQIVCEGGAATNTAMAFRPDLLLIDLGLPTVDGLAVGKQVREIPQLSKTLMVAVTGYGDSSHRADATVAGFDQYLVKPVKSEQLQK